ncbi:hypothetical protein RFI_09907 [Reticulomyxa filosa]|uniref:Uncharacterized protein n=1 Tax=Reticulomyxa filosa TaxID=46433 RepID=X6NLR0_RETFI|nr:hypothetical protein RFI_09907 [Reticulomyxa filosa]|eukprot:ETO27225.1 hypothetical protein RFI_09907 [Reticulomyxa filosa]
MPQFRITGDTLLLNPVIDIVWIDTFVKNPNIRKMLKVLDIRLNELCVHRFEKKHKNISKFKTFSQRQGKIFRINNEFTAKLNELFQQWFKLSKNLWCIKIIRRLTNLIVFDDDEEEKEENKKIGFGDKSPFAKWDPPPQTPYISHFMMAKMQDPPGVWILNAYGDLNKLLLPEMPLGG